MDYDKEVRIADATPTEVADDTFSFDRHAEQANHVEEMEADLPDPQREIFTSCISRAGKSALVVIAEAGVIDSASYGETGFYVGDMRIVSRLLFSINQQQVKVQRTTRDDLITHFWFGFEPIDSHIKAQVDYTLDGQVLVARLQLRNVGTDALPVTLDLTFEADHFDTFYVRFPPRPERGILHAAVPDLHGQTIRYDGIDGRTYPSFVRLSEQPRHLPDGTMQLARTVPAGADWQIIIQAGLDPDVPTAATWDKVNRALQRDRQSAFTDSAQLSSTNPDLSHWLQRSGQGLSVMTAHLETGLYPYAGLPWFAVPFGRDALMSGFQTLLIDPAMMAGVLRFLAKNQARGFDPFNQSQPGKIMHEMRSGETSLARLNPFAHYYGAVDTTPLFVMAVEAYWRRTADKDFLRLMWPHVDLALHWLATGGDMDGDGFIEYAADPGRGLVNQGWKDSSDSIMHASGKIATGPIALCEVQGYAYRAWRAGEAIAALLGHHDRAIVYAKAADRLYQRFNEVFWQEDMGVYALALDGDKRPCRVVTSNIAHLPWCGITPPDRGSRVIEALMQENLFSGWGIRTLAADERRYRADSYHRGPCWPHEMVIAGWSAEAVGNHRAVRKIAETLLDTAQAFNYLLPELFCGYSRIEGLPPTPYKSANPLQAWAVGAGFGILQSALGARVDASRSELSVDASGIPPAWKTLKVSGLRIGAEQVDLAVEPDEHGIFRVRDESAGRHSLTVVDRRARA